ncbi:MAG TPA: hypothetical protein VEC15_06580 [Actinomycetota bacterium]|nr:hypothetical protein [Actinomycetota bacterium]
MSHRRLLALVVVLAALGIPAAVLQVACVGASCDAGSDDAARVPFCGLPERLRELLLNGYREGRSPDVLGVAASPGVFTRPPGTSMRLAWPSPGLDDRVPVILSGTGIRPRVDLPDGVTLDRVAPTIAAALRFQRPFPDVRSGTALDEVIAPGVPRLVLVIAWKGIGTTDLEAWADDLRFTTAFADAGASTMDASTGSAPLDPAAVLTTIGTGGFPSQHGVTGTFLRDDRGEVVRAFDPGAPLTVIATLADDLDAPASAAGPSPFGQEPIVALVATDLADRGLIGGDWYDGHDRDEVVIAPRDRVVRQAEKLLGAMGSDRIPDVLAVALDGNIRALDRATRDLVAAAERAARGRVLTVVVGTGTTELRRLANPDAVLVDAVDAAVPGERSAVSASVAGGVFLDQDTLRLAEVTGQIVSLAMAEVTGPSGTRMMVDTFQGFAVSFARYC